MAVENFHCAGAEDDIPKARFREIVRFDKCIIPEVWLREMVRSDKRIILELLNFQTLYMKTYYLV